MPAHRDYTRAFAVLRDDGYDAGWKHEGYTGFLGQALPGDVWRQSLVGDDETIDQLMQHAAADQSKIPNQSATWSAQDNCRPQGKIRRKPVSTSFYAATSIAPKEHAQPPVLEPNSSSMTTLARPHVEDAKYPSSYTGSFRTARETLMTPTSGFGYSKQQFFASGDRSVAASSEYREDRMTIEALPPIETPAPNLLSVATGSPKHVKANSIGQKSFRADLELVQDDASYAATKYDNDVPLLPRRSSKRDLNVDGDHHPAPRAPTNTMTQASEPNPQTETIPASPKNGSGGSQDVEVEADKRPKTPENAASVVEALVVDTTPPRRKHKLRHSSKDDHLYETASQSGHSNRTSYSDASVLAAPGRMDSLLRRLRDVPSLESDKSSSAGSRALRRTGKFESPPMQRLETLYSVDGEKQDSPIEDRSLIKHSIAETSPEPSSPITSPPAHQLRHKRSSIASARKGSTASSAARPSSSAWLEHKRKVSGMSARSHSRKGSNGSALIGLGISERLYGQQDMLISPRRASHQSGSFQHSRHPSDAPSALSLAQSGHYHGFHSPGSLRSFGSSGWYSPEVDEARTVNLYPHNNTSLLLVQPNHMAADGSYMTPIFPADMLETSSSSSSSFVESEDEFDTPLTRPTIIVDVPTSDFSSDTGYPGLIQDKYTGQRRPTPPVFTLIPPTPADECASAELGYIQFDPQDHDQDSTSASKATHVSQPKRQASLLERARAYSDSVIQPLFKISNPHTGSVRRNVSKRKRYYESGKRISSHQTTQATTEDDNEPASLHPFWQPRYFWSDVDDADADEPIELEAPIYRISTTNEPRDSSISAAEAFEPHRRAPLPPWRRGGSLRFLLGNSLGFERQPTNRKVPLVRFPTGRMRMVRREGGASGLVVGSVESMGDQRVALPPGMVWVEDMERGSGRKGGRERERGGRRRGNGRKRRTWHGLRCHRL